MFWDVLKTSVSAITFASALRLSCPLVIGSMGGCFNEKTSTGNLAYECFMLTGCFFAAFGSFISGSPLVGSLVAILSGLALGGIYGLLVYHLNCNAMIVSVAYNNGAWAMTTLLMVITWGVRGNYTDPAIVSYKTINLEFLKQFPVLDTLFNNAIAMVYLSYVIAVIAMIVMYKTPFGLRLRGGSYYTAPYYWHSESGAVRNDAHLKVHLLGDAMDRCETVGFRCVREVG